MIGNEPVAAYYPPSESSWESELRRKHKLGAGVSAGLMSLAIPKGKGALN